MEINLVKGIPLVVKYIVVFVEILLLEEQVAKEKMILKKYIGLVLKE